MKESTFKEYIENEIYKTLEKFAGKEKITTSQLLKELSFDVSFGKIIKFSHSSLFKAVLFMKIKRIKSQSELARYLKGNREDAINLGFYVDEAGKLAIPNQRTISHFINHMMDGDMRSVLDAIVQKIEEMASKFGIVFDVQTISAKPQEKCNTNQTFNERKNKRLNEVCKFVKKNFYPQIRLDARHNAKYAKNEILDSFTYLCREQTFAHDGLKRLKAESGRRVPDSDTFLYRLKKYDDINEVQEMFVSGFDLLWSTAKSSGLFDRKSYDVAIDFTDWFYYGKRAPMVVRKKPEKGTTKCYRFATINIVEAGSRFTLLTLPVSIFDTKTEIVDKLITYAKSKIRINRIYADRGFFSADIINLFKKHGLTFLMPATQNARIARVIRTMPAPSVIKDYEMTDGKVNFNLVIVSDRDDKRAFATNIDIDERETGLAVRLFNLYSKRWGIETSYRAKKELRARTTSKNYIVRLFYFLFSALLYNIWILIDGIISKSLLGKTIATHLVTGKMFATILFGIVGADSG
ncbi:MAG: transposase [Candidatus Aenigmatarchaeota archaeon]